VTVGSILADIMKSYIDLHGGKETLGFVLRDTGIISGKSDNR
jgi:hypothetical protein